MKRLELLDLEYEVLERCKRLNIPDICRPDFISDECDAKDSVPSVLFESGQYILLVIERGKKIREDKTSNYDEIMYIIFENITFQYAMEIVAKYNQTDDQRLEIFTKQAEMMDEIGIKQQFMEQFKRCVNKLVEFQLFKGY